MTGVWLRISRDAGVFCPALWLSEKLTASGAADVFLYSFGYNETVPGAAVWHGGEVDFVWQRAKPASPTTQSLQEAVGGYWSSFVRSGAPVAPQGWPAWPAFDDAPSVLSSGNVREANTSSASFLDVGSNGLATTGTGFHAKVCKNWQAYVSRGKAELENFNTFGYLC